MTPLADCTKEMVVYTHANHGARESNMAYPVKILTAIHNVMTKVGYVQKKGVNDFHKYKFAGEANLLEVLRPALVEEGLILIPNQTEVSQPDIHGNTLVKIEYTVAHKDGDVWPEKVVVFGSGNDKNSKGGVGDKGLYKAVTGANKYFLFKLFQIETGNDPEEASAHDKADKSPAGISAVKKQLVDVRAEIAACEDEDTLRAYLNTPDCISMVLKICADFPQEWTGPEEHSGLRGTIEFAGKRLGCEQYTQSYLIAGEKKAKGQR